MRTVKGISCQNPYANLIAMRHKTIETRKGSSSAARTFHRGTMYICTSKRPHSAWGDIRKTYEPDGYALNNLDPFLKRACDIIWKKCRYDWLKFYDIMMRPDDDSYMVAEVKLYAIRDMKKEYQEAACCEIYPTAKALMLDEIRAIKPISITGKTNGFHLGLFDINLDQEIEYI